MRAPTAAKLGLALIVASLATLAPAAEISGTKWFDTNKDGIRDSFEPPIPGWTIYADLNGNRSRDNNEPSAVTDINGGYVLRGLSPGSYQIWEVSKDGFFQTFPTPETQFNIELTYPDSTISERARAACELAAQRWEAIIIGDVPNVGDVDDLRIRVFAVAIDDRYGVAAQASGTRFRNGSDHPIEGFVRCDVADIDPSLDDGTFVDIITHEMGHVLGIGVMNPWFDRVNSENFFTGVEAAREYQRIFGLPANSLPPCYSDMAHWSEDTFDTELMSPLLEFPGFQNPLSRVTVAAMSDLGYRVNMGAAQPFVKPGKRAKSRGTSFCEVPHVIPEFVEVPQKSEPKALDTQLRPQLVTINQADQVVTGIDFGNSAYPGRATPTPGPTPRPGTATPTPIPSQTPAPSPTVSPTPIPSPTPSPLPSPSGTPLPTPTASPSPSPSPTPIPIPICGPNTNLLGDGGFEEGSLGAWEFFDAAYSTPVCNSACGGLRAFAGEYFLWFGGLAVANTSRAAQSVAIPPGSRNLRFQLAVYGDTDGVSDALELTVDGVLLGYWRPEDRATFGPWTRVSLDISRFADGRQHTIKFQSLTSGASALNSFLVDDVSIECPGAVQRVVELTTNDPALLDKNADSVLDAADIQLAE